MNHKTKFDNLLEAINSMLPEIQRLFDEYQNNYFPKRPPEFFCLELNGEAGELANAEKKIWKGKPISTELLADEAADVFIALLNYVNSRKIDLTSALIEKLKLIEEKRIILASKGENY
ncbi:MAG: hypothetical protein ACPLPX_06025 [Candidatus Kapaibacteriota bacterium]